MQMQILLLPNHEKNKPRKKPLDHFHKCPACGAKELIAVSPDVLCGQCDWDSTAWDVSRGGMDSLFTAVKEFSFPVFEPAKPSVAEPFVMPLPEPAAESVQNKFQEKKGA